MLIGIPKEIKDHEYRIGATPEFVHALVDAGHRVLVEHNAGQRIGYPNEEYEGAGAQIVPSVKEVYEAEMIVKVKEPQPSEVELMREGQIIFSYLHLAAEPELVKGLLEKKVVSIAYETVTDDAGRLPLLVPMSEVAGRISIQAGAKALHMAYGGKGVLLGGVPGVPSARVVVLGGGVAGTEAARMAVGLGADVTIIERNQARLRQLVDIFGSRVKTRYSTSAAIDEEVTSADLIIGAVLIPGAAAPKLITADMVRRMDQGTVFVDIAIDQGGCSETSRPTTHSDQTYVVDGVVHYCVTNMPGACARTATRALTNATLPYALALADLGYRRAIGRDIHLRQGLNTCLGAVTNMPVADHLGYERVPYEQFLER